MKRETIANIIFVCIIGMLVIVSIVLGGLYLSQERDNTENERIAGINEQLRKQVKNQKRTIEELRDNIDTFGNIFERERKLVERERDINTRNKRLTEREKQINIAERERIEKAREILRRYFDGEKEDREYFDRVRNISEGLRKAAEEEKTTSMD